MCSQALFSQTTEREKNVKIIPQNKSQSFMFTNLLGLFYYGETGMQNTSRYHGLSMLTQKLIEDYVIEIGGQILDRSNAETHLYRDKLNRLYTEPKIIEEIVLSDSLPVLSIKLKSSLRLPFSVMPLFSWFNQKSNYSKSWSSSNKILFITSKKQLVTNTETNEAGWVGVTTFPGGDFTDSNMDKKFSRQQNINTNMFLPGKINSYLEDSIYIFFIIANSKKEIIKYRDQIFKNLNLKIFKEESKIEGIRKA